MRERADEGTTHRVDPRPPQGGTEVLRVSGATTRPGEDGEGSPVLVLTSVAGATFHLPVDGALRAALRQATAPPAAPDAPAPAALRPKDIQTRIRSGESATELAESAGMPLEQVERYAGPVLAERAHVATIGRGTVVRTTRSRPTLEDLVRHRLASRGVALASVEWDAWRRGESGWALQVSFRAGTRDRLAQWSYDPAAESVEPLDDEARWLSASHEAEAPGGGRRLSAVRVFDVENDGGVREVPVVPAPPLLGETGPITGSLNHDTGPVSLPDTTGETRVPWAGPDHDEVAARTMDLLDALSDRRGRRQPMPDLGADGWDDDLDEGEGLDDDLVGALLDLPPSAHPPLSRPDEATDDTVLPAEPRLRSVPVPASWGDTGESPRIDADDPLGSLVTDGAGHGDRPTGGSHALTGPRGVADEAPTPGARTGGLLGLVPDLPPAGPLPDRGASDRAALDRPGAPGGHGPRFHDDQGVPEHPVPDDAHPAGPDTALDDGEHDGAPRGGASPARPRSPRRSSVPSWEEIVFGSPRTDGD